MKQRTTFQTLSRMDLAAVKGGGMGQKAELCMFKECKRNSDCGSSTSGCYCWIRTATFSTCGLRP